MCLVHKLDHDSAEVTQYILLTPLDYICYHYDHLMTFAITLICNVVVTTVVSSQYLLPDALLSLFCFKAWTK